VTDLVYITPTEAAELCRYTTGSNFLRAFRAEGFETIGPPGRPLIKPEDLQSFLRINEYQPAQ